MNLTQRQVEILRLTAEKGWLSYFDDRLCYKNSKRKLTVLALEARGLIAFDRDDEIEFSITAAGREAIGL